MDPRFPSSPELQRLATARAIGDALQLAMVLLRARPPSPAADTPELDAQVLLAHVTGSGRASILAYPERVLSPETAAAFAALIARRMQGEPVAYLVGHREFMGLDLSTD